MHRFALATVVSLASLSLAGGAHADPARHIQFAVTAGGSFADARSPTGERYGVPLSLTLDGRYHNERGHGAILRTSLESAGFLFASDTLSLTRFEAGYAHRLPVAGGGEEPWLVANLFVSGGVALGTATHNTCVLCFTEPNTPLRTHISALSMSAGASLDARIYGGTVGLATEIRTLPASDGPVAVMPFAFLVGLRLGVDGALR